MDSRSYLEYGTYLLQKDAADLFGISPQAVNKLLKEHDVKTEKLGSRLQVITPDGVKAFMKIRNLKPRKLKICVHLVKGGVGKTTLTHGLAIRSASFGHKTLMIDLDQQANLSHSFGIWPKLNSEPTLLNLYEGKFNNKPITIKDVISKITPNLHIIPSNLSLANLESSLLTANENLGSFMSELLDNIDREYDLIFLDCPPALSKITAAAHCFSDVVLMPVNADSFSLEGLDLTIQHLKNLTKKFKISPTTKIVLNKVNQNHKLFIEIVKTIGENYGNLLCEQFISNSKKIENSLAEGNVIWRNRTNNPVLEDIHNLTIELLGLSSWSDEWKKNSKSTVKGSARSKEEVTHGF